jgi:hypothetical protein
MIRMKPMMFLDFDGVLNALMRPLAAYPADGVFWPDRTAVTYPAGYAPTPIHWSSELVDRIRALIIEDRVSFTWLTTWQNYVETELVPALGIADAADKMAVEPWMRHGEVNQFDGKSSAVRRFLTARADTPVVWVDDEIASRTAADWIGLPDRTVLAVRPDPEVGISRVQMDLIDGWIRHPSPGWSFSDESGCHGRHLGL